MQRRGFLSAVGGGLAGGAVLAAGGDAAVAAPGGVPRRRVYTGLDVLMADGWRELAGQRVGVISNPTGVDADYVHEVDRMHVDDRVDIVGVFGPEHGFRGSAQAGGSEGTGTDERTGLTVYDAYGADATKFTQMYARAGVETVVFDIQDVGARFYTYIWTLYDGLVAAARMGLRFVVLDRPNPVGGEAYGPMMTPQYTSGVGEKEIVQQHGMTVGELARFFNGEFVPADANGRRADLTVVKMRGWDRDMRFTDLAGLPWVPPSPNMPTPDTAFVYPGTCMFEGVHISEGRGTTRPFEFIGAPFLDYHWGDRLAAHDLPGVRFREAYFRPSFEDYANELCNGVEVHVTDPHALDPVRTGVAMLVEARRYPEFRWVENSYDPQRPFWIDKLTGSPRMRTMIDAGATVSDVVDAWQDELAAFRQLRRQYLLYR